MSSRGRHNNNAYATYVNPYNSRRKVISKTFILAAIVVLGVTWMSLSLHLVRSNNGSSSTTTVTETLRAMPTPKIANSNKITDSIIKQSTTSTDESHEQTKQKQRQQQRENDKKKNDNNKKKKKDMHDYRTIKIETPPPKAVNYEELKSIDNRVTNLTLTHPIYKGREKLIKMLMEMYIDPTQIDDDIWAQVPVWDDIQKVHGRAPVIYGLDGCQHYRDTVSPLDRRVGIAGMFNTGTNLLAILLQHNCAIPERIAKLGRKKGHGMEWQVPWGKHTPVWYRGRGHVKNFIGQIPEDNIMVAVMVRHAHDWMASMCRHGYTAKWKHTAKNCPNLYLNNTVTAKFGPGPSEHASLAHMWNDWNGAYYDATNFSRVMVRFEDTIFFPKETSRKICSCVGGKLVTPKEQDGLFHYVIDSAKTGPGHGPGQKRNGLIDAWIKYGKARATKLSAPDLQFSEQHVRRDIMESMQWDFPEIK